MILAAIQYKAPKGQTQVAREQLAEMVAEAALRADIIVCPEMAVSGYVWSDRSEILPHTEMALGETFQCLAPIAQQHGCWIVCGIAERDGDSLYNSAIVISSDGELNCCYRKILLYDLDYSWAKSGQERMIIQTEFGTVAPAICMDLNDDRLLYWLWTARPDVLAFCTNWVNEGTDIDDYWAMRTSHWNGWLVAANSWGPDGGIGFRGESAILCPQKKTQTKAPIEGNCILYCDSNSVIK
jgi:predicted amidohydrolase